ncbi:hypothetical protein BDV93DRAFT_563697 [Ceratobasidium sp. AG-I]|nr:hypothetical protein BDV93DRAFT_563697 [Ceratobasidium sp. AG-I]
MNLQVLYEDDIGEFSLSTLVTDSMAELEDSPELDAFVNDPSPTVYADDKHDNFPLVLITRELKTAELQKILRLVFTLLWVYQGGQGKFPWEIVCADLDAWISADRRPPGAILSDPSFMRHAALTTWLQYFRDGQSGNLPPHRHIQFSKVFAGLSPIDASLSQESSRSVEYIPQQMRETYVLQFTETVTQCHAPRGMEYPPASLAYAKFLKRGVASAAANALLSLPAIPETFLELPIGELSSIASIDGQEQALIFKLASLLPGAYGTIVPELVDSLNAFQANSPASSPSGVWVGMYANCMPALLPSSPETLLEGLQYFIKFWVPIGYFTPSAKAEVTSRLLYFQLYIEDILTSPLIRHAPSDTLLGGTNGIVCADLDAWISADRRPPGAILSDPSSMRHAALTTWLQYFRDGQSGNLPPHRRIQFSKVFAGLSPIDASLSQESSRSVEYIPQQMRETYVLQFTETVTQCHAPRGMEYPPASLAYAKFLKRGVASAAANALLSLPAIPETFLELPIGELSSIASIDGQEQALIFKLASLLPGAYGTIVPELVDSLNAFQANSPASSPSGVWVGMYANCMPALLPSSPETLLEGLQYFIKFWVPIGYFTPSAKAEVTSRLLYFQLYIEDILTSPLIRHAPSDTLLGGTNGAICLVRALILLVLNFAAANGDITPSSEPPVGYDLTCLPHEELARVLGWSRQLIEALRASTAILAATSNARKSFVLEPAPAEPEDPVAGPCQSDGFPIVNPPQSPATTGPAPAGPAPAGSAPATAVRGSSSAAPTKSNKTHDRRRGRASKKRRSPAPGADSEESMASEESEQSVAERDFEALDVHSDGSSDLDLDGYSCDPIQPSPLPSLAGGRFTSLNEENEAPTSIMGRSTPRLPEAYLDMFSSGRANSSNLAPVFGPFLPLPPAPQQPPPRSYQGIYAGLDAAIQKLEGTLRAWHELGAPHATRFDEGAQAARQATRSAPAPLQPLVHFFVARRYDWGHAKATAPSVIDFVPHVALNARAALQLDAAVADFWDTEDQANTVSDVERDNLVKLHRRLLKGAIELCWMYKEIVAFERLATEWSNRLPGNWLADEIPTYGPTLYNLVSPLVDWAKAAHALDASLRAQRKQMWLAVGRPFETRHARPLWYCFGNPRPHEMPEGFQTCLRAIERLFDDDDEGSGDLNGATVSVSTENSGVTQGMPLTALTPASSNTNANVMAAVTPSSQTQVAEASVATQATPIDTDPPNVANTTLAPAASTPGPSATPSVSTRSLSAAGSKRPLPVARATRRSVAAAAAAEEASGMQLRGRAKPNNEGAYKRRK